MSQISYSISLPLRETLQKIEVLRRDILLAVISPRKELRFRFEALLERIYWLLALPSNNPLSKNEIVKLLVDPPKKRLTVQQQDVVRLRKTLDYIIQEWLASQKPVPLKTVLFLHHLCCPGRLRVSQKPLKQCLSYFQSSNEHPVIQAGLIYSQLLTLSPFTEGNARLAQLLIYLFLYKEGFDCRGFLVLDEYFRRNLTDYQNILRQIREIGTQTLWLEDFAKAIQSQLEKTMKDINKNRGRDIDVSTSFFQLNDRQKEVLSFLENPDVTITNRQTQKLFKISQITASRDLAKLVSLGLLFTHGKGRSVYYTRV